MNLTFACPRCHAAARTEVRAEAEAIACPACGQQIAVPPEALEGRSVRRCLVCPSTDLFVRKDFPQRAGVGLVAVGIVGSSIAWYYANLPWTFGILFATALVDLILYWVVGDALMCYRCGAQYRGVESMAEHGAFDLETHEKHRQIAARMPTPASASR